MLANRLVCHAEKIVGKTHTFAIPGTCICDHLPPERCPLPGFVADQVGTPISLFVERRKTTCKALRFCQKPLKCRLGMLWLKMGWHALGLRHILRYLDGSQVWNMPVGTFIPRLSSFEEWKPCFVKRRDTTEWQKEYQQILVLIPKAGKAGSWNTTSAFYSRLVGAKKVDVLRRGSGDQWEPANQPV